jgi:hypothetical protein
LDELTVREIRNYVSPSNLPHRDYAPLLKKVLFQQPMRYDTMKFFVVNNLNGWNTYIKWKEWEETLQDVSVQPVEAARLLLWGGNIAMHCNCPAYRFWGMQYICTVLDSAIVPENREPRVRNPHHKGIVCKHLNRTIKVLPFFGGTLAAIIKKQRERRQRRR